MAPSTTPDDSPEALLALKQTTTTLITQFESALHAVASGKDTAPDSTPPPSGSAPSAGSVDPLALAHDAASLIRAHTTKLSLLIINEPFTPSAISKLLRELVAGPIPALATAVEACAASRYTSVARHDLASRCHRVLHEFRALVALIPENGRALTPDQKNGRARQGKGSLAATGVVWAACDDVINLKKLGIAGLLIKKVEEWRDTLKDVLDELKEWGEEADEDEEEEDGPSPAAGVPAQESSVADVTAQMQNSHISTQAMLDDLMNPAHIPRNDTNKIRERLDSCLKRLRLATLLYSAIIKRRLKVLPALPAPDGAAKPSAVQRLDEVFPILKRLPHRFGDVACAFYDMEPAAIDREMDACFFDAFAASELLMKPWDGDADEFTAWAEKFQAGIKAPA